MNVNPSDGESNMSKGGKPSREVFDIERLRTIIELMEQHELSEVDLQQGDEKIKLNRGVAAPAYHAPPLPMSTAAAAPSPTAAAPANASNLITINAPMVGTFYSKANPEKPPFVKVGQRVNEDTIVCIVEAMKVFNEIPAECRGTIVEILVNDQQAVDYGKPMFRVEPDA